MSGDGGKVARIDLEALTANVAQARDLARGRELIAVVKADAYGHGVVPIARSLLAAGCTRLAVLSVAEAAELREAAVAAPILVLAGVEDAREAERAAALHLTPVLHHRGMVRLLAQAAEGAGVGLRVHVEIDTGMRRMGVSAEKADAFLEEVAACRGLELEGVFTHFACADDPDPAVSLEQLACFRRVLEAAESRRIRPPVIHIANSAGLLSGKPIADALPEATAVRPGLLLYGVRPARQLGREVRLRPVMSLRARVAQVRELRPGDAVGYGAEFRADRATRVATLSIGYADGIPWSLGGRGRVVIRGRSHPIVGRVSMDYIGVDVGDDPVGIGDEAVLFGIDELPVEEVAELAGTIPYELLVRVGKRVPHEVVNAGV